MGKEELIPIGSADRVEEIQAKREAVKEANAVPFPGALKDAFDIAPEIIVGDYRIRPFYDGDYDILASLENPLASAMAEVMERKDSKTDYLPRGQTAWEICYLFTNPIEQALDEIKSGTFKENAKQKFFKLRIAGLVAIHEAVMKQLAAYWSTAVGYESIEDDEGVKKNAPTQAI